MKTFTLTRILEKLAKTYTSIDYRCTIIKKNKNWFNVLSVVYFTDKTHNDLRLNYERLATEGGKIDTQNFKILCKSFDIKEWKSFVEKIVSNSFEFNGIKINYRKKIDLENITYNHRDTSSYIKNSVIQGINDFFKLNEVQKINFLEGIELHNDMSIHKDLKKFDSEIRDQSKFTSIYSAIRFWLGVRDFRQSSFCFLLNLPIYAKAIKYPLKDDNLFFKVLFHKALSNLEVIVELISLTNSDHNYFIPIDMKQAEKIDNTPYYQFTFRQNLPIKSSDDKVTIYLKLPSLSKNIDSVEINDIFTIPDNNNFPIIFICALPKEQETLLIELDKLTNLIKKKTKSGCIELYQHKLSEIKAIINCIEGTGNILSKNKTKDLIEKYNPQLVILFGIAAGIKGRVKLRELLITNKVWDLRKFMIEQKHNEQKYYEFEPESIISPKKLSSLFQIKKLKELLDNIFEEDIKIHTDLICGSSNNLIRDENFMIDASRTHRKLGMIEMEAIGVAEICNSYDIPFFIVKSISDYGNINKSDDLHSFCCDLAASSVLYGFLIPDEIDSILKYPENLEKLKKNSQIFKKLDKYEIRKIHLFLDEINNLLDTQFPVIKEKFFPNIWKIGIKISKTEQDDRLRYSFNPISWDVNEILIKEISPLEWIKGVKKNFFLEWGSINKEIILEEPKKYAIGVLSRIIKEIFDNKALYHQGNIFLANEFIFAAINKFKLQLGLEEKNEYTVDEIEKGLEIYLPLWVQQATKTISKDILFNMFKRNGYYDPKFMLFSCHKFQQDWINQRIKDKLSQIPLKIPNIPFENTEMPFRILREFLSFLKKRGVEKVHRLYRPPDYSRMKKPADLIYNKYEPEDLERNIRLFFQNLIPSYNTLLKNNFPELKDKLPYFYGATKILVEIDLKKYYHSRYDVPTKTVLYLKNKEVTDLSVDILLKSEGNIPDDVFVTKTLEYKGKNYSVLAGSFGILDFIFQDLPMFDTVYKILIDNLGRYLGFDTSEFSLKGFS